MARQKKKKKGDQSKALQSIALITAVLNLIKSLIDLVNKLLE